LIFSLVVFFLFKQVIEICYSVCVKITVKICLFKKYIYVYTLICTCFIFLTFYLFIKLTCHKHISINVFMDHHEILISYDYRSEAMLYLRLRMSEYREYFSKYLFNHNYVVLLSSWHRLFVILMPVFNINQL